MANEYPKNALSRRNRERDERVPQLVAKPEPGRRGVVVPGRPVAPESTEGMNAKLLLRGLAQHWIAALILGTAVGGACAAAAWYLTPAPYESTSVIKIESLMPKLIFDTADNRKFDQHYTRNQLQLITSGLVIQRALSRPEVAEVALFKGMKDPRVYLKKYLKAAAPRSPEIVNLSLTGEDPAGLAIVVNAIQEAYFQEIVDLERSNRLKRFQELKTILDEKEDQIRAKRSMLKKITEVVGASPDSDVAVVQHKNTLDMMTGVRNQLMQKHFELLRAQMLLNSIQGGKKQTASAIPDELIESYLATDPEIQKLEQQIAQKQALLVDTEKAVKNKVDHPTLQDLRRQIANLEKSVRDLEARLRPRVELRLQAELSAKNAGNLQDMKFQVDLLTREEAQLRTEFERLESEASKLGATSFEVEDLKDDIATVDKLSNQIMHEMNALQVELSAPSRVLLLQRAEAPSQRDPKRRYMATLGAGAGGFALVCFLIAFAEARLRRILSVDDVSNTLRVMGQVPMVPAWTSKSVRAASSRRGRYWNDVLTESIDSARALMVHDAELEDARVIMVVSAIPSEGKTTLSCHLASSLARAGKKVVLMDCDLRRPNVHRVFGMKNDVGFCEVLLGKAEIDDVIQPGVAGGPAILSVGQLTPEVPPLLGMDVADQIFQALRERFEFVVVDTAPVMLVHDTLIVSRYVDAAVVAVRRNVSRQAKVAALVDRLQSLEVPVLGTVAIGLDSELNDYGHGYYRGYSKYYSSGKNR